MQTMGRATLYKYLMGLAVIWLLIVGSLTTRYSLTNDEAMYLGAGISYWEKGNLH